MILITSKYLIPRGYSGITLYPFVMLREKELKNNSVLINHEKIHLRQQAELFILFFYIWYVAEYLFLFIKFRNRKKAYRNISFEKEAYTHEKDMEYLNHRPLWSFLKQQSAYN